MAYKSPKRRFESSGFVNPKTAYYVPIENVTNADKEDMKTMVDNGRYFSIFAPRQSGKTTFFRIFSKELETNLDYIFILMSFENCDDYDLKTFYHHIQNIMYKQLIKRLETVRCNQLNIVRQFLNKHVLHDSYSLYLLFEKLNTIIIKKKIVIFIDEFDGIPLREIKNFLTTLRKLYQEYKDQKEKALYSVGLIGIRNIAKLVVGGISPFNIADHIELPPFTFNNIKSLYKQYTQETNQPFSEKAIQKIFEQTQGQPWLVNRIGNILTKKIKPETEDKIEVNDVDNAIQLLLKENNSHFDNLKEKVLLYKETFKAINSQKIQYIPDDDAQSWLYQYGLIKEQNDIVIISNPIYSNRFLLSNDKQVIINCKKKIFISYCHEDKQWLNVIASHLVILKHEDIDIWFDDNIKTGEKWSPAIENAIQTSHMAICLISKNYLLSDFIRERELPAIKTKQKEGMYVFPILIKDCLWNVISWLKEIQIYPKDGIALEDLNKKEKEKKLNQIVIDVSELLKNM